MKHLLLIVCLSGVFHAQAGTIGSGDPASDTTTAIAPSYAWSVEQNDALNVVTVSIDGELPSVTTLALINLRGQELYHTQFTGVDAQSSYHINTSSLERGVYYVKIDTGAEIRLRPFSVR